MRRIGMGVLGALALGGMFAIAQDGPKPGALPGKYAGEATCKKCHFKQSKQWKTTAHAKAHEVLPAKYKDDASCTICHTTGMGQPGGFESTAKTPGLAGVQCEMCHGPAAEHAEFAKANEKQKDDPAIQEKLKAGHASSAEACVRCHVTQRHGQHPEYEK